MNKSLKCLPTSYSKALVLLVLSFIITIHKCSCFAFHPTQTRYNAQRASLSTKLSFSDVDSAIEAFTSLSGLKEDEIYAHTTDMISQAATSMSSNPDLVEGVVVQDLSHIALDLSTFFINRENTTLLRLIVFIGRILSFGGDYIPDHSLSPDELTYQVIMLSLSSVALSRSILPRMKAYMIQKPNVLPDRRDVLAYRGLFEPVGVSWIQFKSLLANKAMEWVAVEAGDHTPQMKSSRSSLTRPEEEKRGKTYFYWVYDRETKSFDAPDNIGEFACMQFLRKIEKRKKTKKKSSTETPGFSSNDTDFHQLLSQHKNSLSEDSTFLRINTDQMIRAMEENEALSVSILFLVVNCLQHKVANLYA